MDCGINGAFKQKMKAAKGRGEIAYKLTDSIETRRVKLFKAIKGCLEEALTETRILQCFEKTGLYPWNPLKVLEDSGLVSDSLPPLLDEKLNSLRGVKGPNIAGKCLTHEDNIKDMEARTKRAQDKVIAAAERLAARVEAQKKRAQEKEVKATAKAEKKAKADAAKADKAEKAEGKKRRLSDTPSPPDAKRRRPLEAVIDSSQPPSKSNAKAKSSARGKENANLPSFVIDLQESWDDQEWHE